MVQNAEQGQPMPQGAKEALAFTKALATDPDKVKQHIDAFNGDKAAADTAINTAIQTTANLLSRTIEGQTTTYGDRLTELKKDALGKLTPEESADAEKVNAALVDAAKQLEGEMKGSTLDPKDMELLDLDPISSLEAISPNNPNQPKTYEEQATDAKAKVELFEGESKKDATEAQKAQDADTADKLQQTQDAQPPLKPQEVLDALAKGPDAVSKLTEGRSSAEEQKVQEVVKNLKGVLQKDTKFTEDPLYKTQLEGVVNAEKDKIAKELTAADSNLQGPELDAKVNEQLQGRMEELQIQAAVQLAGEILADPAKAEQYEDSPFVQEMKKQAQENKDEAGKTVDKALKDAPQEVKDLLTGKDTGDPATVESRMRKMMDWYRAQPTWVKVAIILFLLNIGSHMLAVIAPLYTIGLAGMQATAFGEWTTGAVGAWHVKQMNKEKKAAAEAKATDPEVAEATPLADAPTSVAQPVSTQPAQPGATAQGGTDSAGEAEDTATGNDETSPQTPPVQQPETTPVVPPAPSHPDQGQQSPEPPQQPTPDSPQAPTPPKPQTPPPGGQPGPGTGPAA